MKKGQKPREHRRLMKTKRGKKKITINKGIKKKSKLKNYGMSTYTKYNKFGDKINLEVYYEVKKRDKDGNVVLFDVVKKEHPSLMVEDKNGHLRKRIYTIPVDRKTYCIQKGMNDDISVKAQCEFETDKRAFNEGYKKISMTGISEKQSRKKNNAKIL